MWGAENGQQGLEMRCIRARILPALILGLAWTAPASALQEQRDTLPGDPDARLSDAVRSSLQGLDAAVGGWPTEVLQSAAGDALKLIAHELFTPAGEDALSAVVSPSVSTQALVPERRSERFHDRLYVVGRLDSRAAEIEGRTGRAALLEALGVLRAVFDGCAETHFHFDVRGVVHDPQGDAVQTAVHVELDGRGPGGAVQVTAEWRCGWSVDAEGELTLQSIEVLDYEQVRGPRRAEPSSVTSVRPFSVPECWPRSSPRA